MDSKVSLEKIAQISNVSVATVSRVINNRTGPSKKTVQIVRDVMGKLGYTPPPPAMRNGRPLQKPIKGTRTGMFATVLFGLDTTISESPFNELMRSVSIELSKCGYTMLLDSVFDAANIPPLVAGGKVDGILCIGSLDFPESVIRKYSKVPTVWMMHAYGGWGDHVLPDSELVGKKAAEYLLGGGHKNVACMSGVKLERDDLFYLRCRSFKQMAQSLGMNVSAFSTEYMYPERFAHNKMDFMNSIHRAYKMFMEEFVELDPMPTAIFCPSDVEAFVLYRYIAEQGLVAGVDVEVVGCSNMTSQLASLDPIPATFDLQVDVIARRAVEQLLWRVDNPTAQGTTKILVDPELVLNSCSVLTDKIERK